MRKPARRCLLLFLALVAVAGHAATPVVIHVDDDAGPGGNGSSRFPFDNLPDAVAASRTVLDPVIIKVEPGDYALDSTLLIDRPLELRGATVPVMGLDGWPTGAAVPGSATRLFAANPEMTRLILVGRTNSSVLQNVTIRHFVLEGTAGGISILLNRVQGYWIAENLFRAPANFAMQSVASSGRVSGNHFSGVGTGAIFAGGYPGSPSIVVFQGNRAVRNALGGVLLNGASINLPEPGDEVHAVIRNNDLSENDGPQGFGFRAFILRRDLGAPGDTQSSASVFALVQGNRIVGNRVGIVIDAGFPYRRDDTVCDPRVYSGTMDLRFRGNALSDSLVSSSLITFTRSTAALTPSTLSTWKYLHAATFVIDDADGILASSWIDHPATDPFLGPCPGDETREPLGNSLIYNGQLLSNGRNF